MHSYVFYPLILKFLSKNKKLNAICFNKNDGDLPHVSILMAVYNEEKIIKQKLDSLFIQNYPSSHLHLYIGSDNSNDNTNNIINDYRNNKEISLSFVPFSNRQGKPSIINQLYNKCTKQHGQHIIIITDASAILNTNTVFEMVKHFKNDKIGLVDSRLIHTGIEEVGISKSEDQYISNEGLMKYREGLLNGTMIGPFGACYSLRSNLYSIVPNNYLVDDFYISMKVLEEKKQCISDNQAKVYESVSHDIKEEFRRKKRISAGNFQNLSTFAHLLSWSKGQIAFNFWSHKVLRWLGPFFILKIIFCTVILAIYGNLYHRLLFISVGMIIFAIPVIDLLLQSVNIHIKIFRSIRYFFMMNLALLIGFFNYLKGIKSNVWQPTERPH